MTPTEPSSSEPLSTTIPTAKAAAPTSPLSALQYQQKLQQNNNNNINNIINNSSNQSPPHHYGIAAPKRNTISYQQSCLIRSIPTSFIIGSLYGAYLTFQTHMQDSSSGRHPRPQHTSSSSSSSSSSTLLRTFGTSIGVVYVYYIIQCPMEAIHNKASFLHNGIAAFTISFIGLAQQKLGVPFVPTYSLYHVPFLARNILGASIYSGIAMGIAAVYGRKPF
jgi:hypothetical protein